MISWWLGRPAEDARRVEDEVDAPETPAPLFAARAFKRAIFGTPGPEGDYAEDQDSPPQKPAMFQDIRPAVSQKAGTGSPTKPQGILVTPGTATTRRKTVTFGAAVVDNEGKAVGKSGIPNDCPGKFPSPWTPKVDGEPQSRQARKTALTRTLEAARDGKSKKSKDDIGLNECVQLKGQNEAAAPAECDSEVTDLKERAPKRMRTSSLESYDGDITLDLNEPHSQSGRYWKSEYERYHEEAKAQMKKLVKYKQLAKSYAKKKDGEAIDLAEKLNEEQHKVAAMEDRITDFITQIAAKKTDGDEETPHLLGELAKQTTLAVQHGEQVDKFGAVLQEREDDIDRQETGSDPRLASPRTAKTLDETIRELRKARKQLGEMSSLRTETHSLRLDCQAAEKKASRLREENARLCEDLAHKQSQLLSSEQCRNEAEAQNQLRDVSLLQLRKDYDALKELAKSQRRDAEHLLKKRHEQVAGLRKEIASLKELAETPSGNQAKSPNARYNSRPGRSEQLEVGAISQGGSGHPINLISLDTPEREGPRKGLPTHTRLQSTQMVRLIPRDGDSLLDSKIPVLERSSMKPSRKDAANHHEECENTPTKTITRRHSQPPLGEIANNNVAVERPTIGAVKAPGSPFTTSFHERFSNLSLSSPMARLPSLEPSWNPSVQALKTKPSVLSPRPSMFNIPSSPPKHNLPRPRSSGNDSNAKVTGVPPSSRLSSLNSTRARIVLPPERAAAAKARLEQKKKESRDAEKKRLQEADEGKENIRN